MITRLIPWAFAAALAWGQTPAFEVASVKLSTPGAPGGRVQFLPGGLFRATNVPLSFLILNAYQVHDFYQIVGDPRWMAVIADGENARYQIEARGNPTASEAQVREMVKTLLADRFQLKVHQETRGLPVYALIPAKGGIQLQPPKDDGNSRLKGSFGVVDRGWIQGFAVGMDALAEVLTRNTDRPVIDKTGFTGTFDFRLTWTPDTSAPADATGAGLCPASFERGQEKLGMKTRNLELPLDLHRRARSAWAQARSPKGTDGRPGGRSRRTPVGKLDGAF